MPSFEFIVPQGFLFISANLSFISFCFFISFILSKILKSSIVFFVLLIALLSMAYSDLFLKFAIKNFYELTQMDSKIYMYPTKNEAQKVDSLSIVNIYSHPLKYSNLLTSIEKDEIRVIHENYVERFIDVSTYSYKYNRIVSNMERVYLNGYKDNSANHEKPKFLIEKSMKITFLPRIFTNQEYKFIDTNTNNVLATAFNISFVVSNNKFRNRYLFWGNEKEVEFNQSSLQNFDYIYKKLFIDDVRGVLK